MEFCCTSQELYGRSKYNINLHLHAHHLSRIWEHGPYIPFGYFFERLNGILGSFHTNCKDASIQPIRKFLQLSDYGVEYWPVEYRDEFAPLIPGCHYCKGSLMPHSLVVSRKETSW